MKSPITCLSATIILIFAACGGNAKKEHEAAAPPSVITEAEVRDIYGQYTSGNYAAYVDAMHSCDDKPEEYRHQMATLLKQHAAEHRADLGDTKSVEVVRINAPQGEKYAEAYLGITYTGGKQEEVILRFIYINGRWRLQ